MYYQILKTNIKKAAISKENLHLEPGDKTCARSHANFMIVPIHHENKMLSMGLNCLILVLFLIHYHCQRPPGLSLCCPQVPSGSQLRIRP